MKLLFMVLVLFLFAPAHAQICTPPKTPQKYLETEKQLQKKLEQLANKAIFAKEADSLLSKLIAAKSKVIQSWMKRRSLSGKTDVQIIKAWRGYYLENFILSKYPHNEPQKNKEIEKLVDSVIQLYSSKELKAELNSHFQQARAAALQSIHNWKLPQKSKEQIVKRITNVKLYWPKNLRSARNNSIPLDIIKWGIAYDPVPNEINIGLRALNYPNKTTYLAVFAHELGHAIDSCRWQAFMSGPWPFEKVGHCLRSSKSVSAKPRDDSSMPALIEKGKLTKQLAASLKSNKTCNKLGYPPGDLQKDQLPESFADWFSAEAMASLTKEADFTNLRTDLCADKKLKKGSSYPTNQLRLGAIYKTQPSIAKAVGYQSKYRYCSLN